MPSNKKIITYGAIGLGVGGLLYYFMRSAGAAVLEPPEEPIEGPEGPDPGQIAGGGEGATKVGGKRVPAKVGTQNYNHALFPNADIARAKLAGLSPKYTPASQGGAAYTEAARRFQRDWNDLAKLNALSPARLNDTVLVEDGVPGGQHLRGLEWALSMPWAMRLAETGLGT